MGREMVDLFTKEGAQVIAADINEKAVAKVNELDNVYGTLLDVSSDESWKKMMDTVIEKFGRVDILVNNAGISTEKQINDTTLADWQLMLSVNGFGPFCVSHT